MLATLANTFVFILQGSALAGWPQFLSAIVKDLLKSDSICKSYVHVKNGPVFFDSQCIITSAMQG